MQRDTITANYIWCFYVQPMRFHGGRSHWTIDQSSCSVHYCSAPGSDAVFLKDLCLFIFLLKTFKRNIWHKVECWQPYTLPASFSPLCLTFKGYAKYEGCLNKAKFRCLCFPKAQSCYKYPAARPEVLRNIGLVDTLLLWSW